MEGNVRTGQRRRLKLLGLSHHRPDTLASGSPKAGHEIRDNPVFPLDDWIGYAHAWSRGRQTGDDRHGSRGPPAGDTGDDRARCPANSSRTPRVLRARTHFAGVR